ncbi:MAG: PecA family PE domain-processing aspartic protease, partial [Mycobacterium sp.]
AETAPAAAVPGPAADPAPEMTSWLPATPIVPGSKVALALQEIADAQGIITAQTWGSGNVFAGVVAIVPQVFLASAALSLQAWGATNPAAQGFLAATAGIPLIQQAAQVTLLSTMLLPTFAEASMAGAALFLPLVNLFGADVSAAQAEVAAARQDGKVYAVVPVRMVASTQPVVGVSVNGGSNATLLVDSGASGLVTTRDKVGAGDLGAPIGAGSSCFSGGLCYDYTTYNTTVDLGGGASTTAPVNIVDAEDEQLFKDFFSWGADGILGTGANTAGPGPVAIPTALMPGELSNGVLLFQNLFFGLGGVMVLGPNPLPTRVSVPGAPDAFVQVSVNGGPKNDAAAIIDSGGVYGTLNRDLYDPSFVGSSLPAGTVISVYTADGSTLLYSYTTQSGARATQVIDSGLFNTGNAPFAQGPIYLNYGFDEPYGIGSTDFSIW